MLRLILYILLAMLVTGCPSAMLSTAVLGSSIADERSIGAQIDDIAIISKIMARLAAEKDMPSRWLSVDSIEGKVSLMGFLKNQEQINRAVFIAKSFQGVKNVHSEIKVGEPSLKSLMTDGWITSKVKTRLLKDGKTSGVAVHVETIEGRVYLQGMVRNDEQYQRAIELAATTPGVLEVVDMLKLNPHGTKDEVHKAGKKNRLSGSRKAHGSKSKPMAAKPQEVFDDVVVENARPEVPEEDQAETIPLSALESQGDIFEETVSGIRHRRPEKESVRIDPYEDHSEDGLFDDGEEADVQHESNKNEQSSDNKSDAKHSHSSSKKEDVSKSHDKSGDKKEVLDDSDEYDDLKSRKNSL